MFVVTFILANEHKTGSQQSEVEKSKKCANETRSVNNQSVGIPTLLTLITIFGVLFLFLFYLREKVSLSALLGYDIKHGEIGEIRL